MSRNKKVAPMRSGLSDTINYSQLVKQTLIALRGRRSSEKLSRDLGYTFNQVNRWESGRKIILWTDFIKLAAACGRNPLEDLRSVIVFSMLGDPGNSSEVLKLIFGAYNIESISKRLGISRFKVSRWLDGKVTPSLQEVLRAIDYFSGYLVDVYSSLNIVERVPDILNRRKKLQELADFMEEHPYAAGFLWGFLLKPYVDAPEHIPGFASRRLGLDPKLEESLLKKCEAIGLLEKADSKYVPQMRKLNMSTLPRHIGLGVRKYWHHRAGEVMQKAQQGQSVPHLLSGYSEFTLNKKALPELTQLYLDFYQSLSSLTQKYQSGPPEEMRVLSVQIFDPQNLETGVINSDQLATAKEH